MARIAKITVRPAVLLFLVDGEFSLDTATQNFLAVISSMEEHGSEKALLDGREVVGDPTVIQRFYYGEFAADVVRQHRDRTRHGRNPQFAYILHEPVLDPQRFGETVAVNRGMNIKVFDNLEEAVEWLGLLPVDVAALNSELNEPVTK